MAGFFTKKRLGSNLLTHLLTAYLVIAITGFFSLSNSNVLRPDDYTDSWHNGGFFAAAGNNNECLAQNTASIKRAQRNSPLPVRIGFFRAFMPEGIFISAGYPVNLLLNETRDDKTSSIRDRIILNLRI